MIKKTMTYVDFDGNERTEDFWFHLSQAEVAEMEITTGGITKMMERLVQEQDNKRIYEIFKQLLTKSYGVKSLDGKRFVKNQEVLDAFMQTEAFSDLIMELLGDANSAAEFFKGVLPRPKAE